MVKKFQASRLSYRSSMINKNQGGGNKKQGTPPSVGTTFSFIRGLSRAYSPPKQRNMVFCINQGGGVGTRAYQTMAPFDGVRRPCKGERRLNSLVKALDVEVGLFDMGAGEQLNPMLQAGLCLCLLRLLNTVILR